MILEMNKVIKNQSTTLLYLNVIELYIYPFTFKGQIYEVGAGVMSALFI